MTRFAPLLLRLLPAAYLLALAVPMLGQHGLWFDEVFSVVMSRSLDSLRETLLPYENNMLLHYLLLWLWMPLGDGSEVFLRSSSLLLVLLSLLPLHAAARQLLGPAAAATTCLVYASHALVLQHAPMCRGYALVLLASALLCQLWVRAWASGRRADWLWVGLLAGLGTWTHYFMALLPLVLLCAMLWRDGLRQPWRALGSAAAVFVLLTSLLYLTRPPDGANQIGWIERPGWLAIQATLANIAGADGLWENRYLLGLLPLLAGLLAWRGWHGPPGSGRHPCVGLGLGLVLVVGAVLVESLVAQPLFVYRYFTALVVPFCLVLAALLHLAGPRLRAGLLAGLLAVSAWDFTHPLHPQLVQARYPWLPIATELARSLQPGDLLLVYPTYQHLPVDYYLDRLDPQRQLPRATPYASAPFRPGGGPEPEPDWVTVHEQVAQATGRVWLVADGKNLASWQRLNRVHAPQLRKQLQYLSGRRLAARSSYGFITVERFDRLPPR